MPTIKIDDADIQLGKGATARDVASRLPNKEDILVCRINGKLSDLSTEVKHGDSVEFLTFEDSEAQQVFWHSSAHVLGYAILNTYPGALLSSGPPTESGFFYDVKLDEPFTQSDYQRLEKEAKRIIKRNYVFEKLLKTKDELLEEYRHNPYKTHFVNEKVRAASTVYKVGAFSDLCQGPHIYSTGAIKSFKIQKNSSAYFLGDAKNASLQRIFGVSFPRKGMLEAFLEAQEKARERDHRRVGMEMDLFFFHPYAPGSAFFLPEGAAVYNGLVDFIKDEYRARGFQEVITPNLFDIELWKESGHLENYRENMFLVGDKMGLKPMNCPGHCIIFRHTERTYKELPLRLADFGVLHRNELKGALSGLTRVRRLQQDDAHIFCTRGQVQSEIEGCLEFLGHVYRKLGFSFEVLLSTRPEKFLGDVSEWDHAEDALRRALDKGEGRYKINEGDGAFYGPKIDIIILDALNRKHQCATIQLDFQLPQRFNLKFKRSDGGYEAPVIIHRAILGSVERMIAILLENYGKHLPFWLSPRQIALVPVGPSVERYAEEVFHAFSEFKIRAFDDESLTFNKRIRNAQVGGYIVIVVVGEKEQASRTLSVRVENETRTYGAEELLGILQWRVKNRMDLPGVEDLRISTE
ncbi:UNVERIFIED_CONTAM: hypothetical protein PYX00_011382 [Menopon gallinae]|uniref:Probable threonine--tRNA ligase, cytoplasmic n=1 Tax=Menopon gallinae TaxID=328185 RepID=A0AAW2H7T5_9NEOP